MTVWHEERGSGEPVVLLHSGVADSGMWDPQWEPLGERFRVIRLDFRGHGRTPCVAEGPYSDAGAKTTIRTPPCAASRPVRS
ncbi:alpha/beta fold hydrolase, partial [Microbispora rosea]